MLEWLQSSSAENVTLLCAAIMLLSTIALVAQRTPSDGVYSAAQADRGRKVFESTCVSCHGADLTGGVGSALKGDEFIRAWSGLTLKSLFDRIRTMPPNASLPLTEDAALETLTYVLSANGFPMGEELSNAALDGIHFGDGNGSEAVPNFSLVQTVGCLTRRADGNWFVTNATSPVRTKDPNPATGDDRLRLASLLLGDQVFRAMNVYPSPEGFVGHRVEVKGLLIRGGEDRLNVTSLTSLSVACGK